jgi:uncharacterized membrane protein
VLSQFGSQSINASITTMEAELPVIVYAYQYANYLTTNNYTTSNCSALYTGYGLTEVAADALCKDS